MEKSLYQRTTTKRYGIYSIWVFFVSYFHKDCRLILWLIFLYNFKSIPNSITTLLGKQG